MNTPQQCLRHAEECLEAAEATENPEWVVALSQRAHGWMMLADMKIRTGGTDG